MKNFFLVSCSVLLFGLFVFLLVSGDKTGRIDVQVKGDSFFEGLRIVHKRQGEEQWLLTARRADLSKDGSSASLSGIEMKIPDKQITIRAETGRYDMNSKRVSIDGEISASNPDYAITTSGIEIDSAAGTLATDQNVSVQGKRFLLTGKGMRIDKNAQQVRILQNVKATFHQ
ncbi:MAG: hypothetical protein OHK006_10270 [Thermodesulfovibrionales bacterium]